MLHPIYTYLFKQLDSLFIENSENTSKMILNDGQCHIVTDEIHGYVAWQHEPCLLRVISSSIKRRAMTWNVPEPKSSLRDLWNNVVMTPGRVCWLIRTDYIQSDWTRGRMVKGRRGYTTIGLPGRGLAWMSLFKSRIYLDTTETSILGKQAKAKLIKKILWPLILEPTKGMCCLRQRQMGCPDTDSSQNLPKTLLAGRVAALVPSSQS